MTLREYTLLLLKDCGCPENTYRGKFGKEYALADMQEYAKDHNVPFAVEDVAAELIRIGNEPIYIEEEYEYPAFNDWGSWGICEDKYCLYDEGKALEVALASGKVFNTGWHGFKKEIVSMQVGRRDDGSVFVSVGRSIDGIDDGPDLICDCLNNEEEAQLTDEMIDEITEALYADYDFRTDADDTAFLPQTATLEDVLKEAARISGELDELLTESFRECIGTTLYVLYGHPEDTKFIEERMAKA